MQTINEVLHFLNKLDLVANLEKDEFKNFNCIKKVLANDFRDLTTEKLINMLNFVDDIYFLFVTQGFQNFRVKTDVLRVDIFLFFNDKIEIEKWINCYLVNNCKSKRIL